MDFNVEFTGERGSEVDLVPDGLEERDSDGDLVTGLIGERGTDVDLTSEWPGEMGSDVDLDSAGLEERDFVPISTNACCSDVDITSKSMIGLDNSDFVLPELISEATASVRELH